MSNNGFIRRLADGNICKLNYDTQLNNFDTNASGEKVYDTVLIATIISPGGGNQEAVQEVKRVFGNKSRGVRINKLIFDSLSHLVDEFEKGHDGAIDGTPIEDLSFIHPSMVGLLKVKNIFTAEILAAVPDSALSGLGMGGRELREKARYYLDSQKSAAPALALAAQKEEVEKKLADMQKIVDEQSKIINEVIEPKRKPGRPKKEESVDIGEAA